MKRADEQASAQAEAPTKAASAPTPTPKHDPSSPKDGMDDPRHRIQGLEAERDRLRNELGQANERSLRLRADYDNLVKRTARESQDAVRSVRAAIVLRVAALVENLEALAHDLDKRLGPDAKGLRMVLEEARRILKDEGVKEIPGTGQPFNYRYHQAVERVETSQHKEGTIVEVVHRGYQMGEDVLRPALVKVAAPPKPPATT